MGRQLSATGIRIRDGNGMGRSHYITIGHACMTAWREGL